MSKLITAHSECMDQEWLRGDGGAGHRLDRQGEPILMSQKPKNTREKTNAKSKVFTINSKKTKKSGRFHRSQYLVVFILDVNRKSPKTRSSWSRAAREDGWKGWARSRQKVYTWYWTKTQIAAEFFWHIKVLYNAINLYLTQNGYCTSSRTPFWY